MEYSSFEEAKKYNNIKNNIIEFVNTKRNLFIKILLEQRNALIAYELNKIKKSHSKIKSLLEQKTKDKMNKNLFLPMTKNVKLSNKKIILSYNQKNKAYEDLNLFRYKNSRSIPKLDKIERSKNSIYTLENEKNSSNKVNINIKQLSLSDKSNKEIYSLSVRNNRATVINSKNKNQNNLIIKKSLFNRNSTNYENNNSNRQNTYFNKVGNSYVRKIYHSRTRKKLVPYISYSNPKKVKGGVTPMIIKEYHKKYPEMRNNIDANNFYLENQNIFDSLLNNEDKINLRYDSKTARTRIKSNKEDIISKNIIYSNDSIKQEKNNEDNNYIGNISNYNSIGNQTEYNFYKIHEKKNNNYNAVGIIDFLCLDNWEEKLQFQKNFFSE